MVVVPEFIENNYSSELQKSLQLYVLKRFISSFQLFLFFIFKSLTCSFHYLAWLLGSRLGYVNFKFISFTTRNSTNQLYYSKGYRTTEIRGCFA
jgi:hypothetical protein